MRCTPARAIAQRRGLILVFGVVLLASTALPAESADRPSANGAPRPASLTADLVWPLPPDPPRIRFVAEYRGEADFRKKPGILRRLMLGPEPDTAVQMRKPYGVAASDDGRIYVTDTGAACVFAFAPERREVRRFGIEGRVRFKTPTGIAVDERGIVFVGDSALGTIVALDPGGAPAMNFAGHGMTNVAGLAIDRARQRLYAVDTRAHRLFAWDSRSGAFIASWGGRGSGAGLFNYPTNVAVDASGRIYVTDTGNFRVQILEPDGKYAGSFGSAGDSPGRFHRPKGIGVDSDGHVYVADAAFNNFQIFDATGRLLLFVGTTGTEPGNFWLPAGLAIDRKDRVYVVDQTNARVQVFQYLKAPGTP